MVSCILLQQLHPPEDQYHHHSEPWSYGNVNTLGIYFFVSAMRSNDHESLLSLQFQQNNDNNYSCDAMAGLLCACALNIADKIKEEQHLKIQMQIFYYSKLIATSKSRWRIEINWKLLLCQNILQMQTSYLSCIWYV